MFQVEKVVTHIHTKEQNVDRPCFIGKVGNENKRPNKNLVKARKPNIANQNKPTMVYGKKKIQLFYQPFSCIVFQNSLSHLCTILALLPSRPPNNM